MKYLPDEKAGHFGSQELSWGHPVIFFQNEEFRVKTG
jgi:hypothetical protein